MAGKFFKYLPKSASFSVPNHANIKSNNNNKLFSGPIVMSMIPDRYCRRKRNDMLEEEDDEPGSPKVSCIGQVNPKKDKPKNKKMAKSKTKKQLLVASEEEKGGKKRSSTSSVIHWMFGRKVRVDAGRSGGEQAVEAAPRIVDVGMKMRKYASGRDAFKDFDWRAMSFDAGKEEEVIVPHSAPILVGGGAVAPEPKREMNIWMRRPAWAPPVPLQVK